MTTHLFNTGYLILQVFVSQAQVNKMSFNVQESRFSFCVYIFSRK